MRKPAPPRFVQPVLHGLFGDKIANRDFSWAIKMQFRVHGEGIPVSELKKTLKTRTVAIFVHGLMADESIWKGFRLGRKCSKLCIRYNTGKHISENGQELAALLSELQSYYGIKKIFLVGHSMGGLVIRSACYYGRLQKQKWVKNISNVYLIAVPNSGAALEKISHATSLIMRGIARWYLGHIGNIIEQRSNGIKDLRLGFMLDEDWQQPNKQRGTVPPLPWVKYHILVATLAKNDQSLLAKYFGDGLVTPGSAVARTLLNVSTVKTFPGYGHNSILESAEVHQYLRQHCT